MIALLPESSTTKEMCLGFGEKNGAAKCEKCDEVRIPHLAPATTLEDQAHAEEVKPERPRESFSKMFESILPRIMIRTEVRIMFESLI